MSKGWIGNTWINKSAIRITLHEEILEIVEKLIWWNTINTYISPD
jgi:hypothetical protein